MPYRRDSPKLHRTTASPWKSGANGSSLGPMRRILGTAIALSTLALGTFTLLRRDHTPLYVRKIHVDLEALTVAVMTHAMRHDGHHPRALEELLQQNGCGIRYRSESPRLPVDPWGRSYRMEQTPDGLWPSVSTLGADDRIRGRGKDADHRWIDGSCTCTPR